MPPPPPEKHGLLQDSPSSIASTAAGTSTQPPGARHRPVYARVSSVSFIDSTATSDITDTLHETEPPATPTHAGGGHGLGIALNATSTATARHSRAAMPSTLRDSLASTVEHEEPIPRSTPSTGALSGSTRFNDSPSGYDISYGGAKSAHKASRTSLASTLPGSTAGRSDTGLLSSIRSQYNDFEPHHHCRSSRSAQHSRFGHWLPITIISLAIFSTIVSGIFWVTALRGPKWGRRIRTNGGAITPSTAAFLTSALAKLVELAFVTVVVAFVGQALARRAFKLENARGVTLAEMSMRTWIMQPGTMVTHWESVRYAAASSLGFISLLAALVAMLYTSAATALVQPQLKFSNWEPAYLGGLVQTQFANIDYIAKHCKTPIQENYDTFDNGKARRTSCLELEHAALAYHNYNTFLGTWTDSINNGSGGAIWDTRPKGYALHHDNTTISAPWINRHDISVVSAEKPKRFINNATMAVPHIGVIQAALDPMNQLMQPDDMDGVQINIRASTPSPFVNVLCVTLHKQDLKPFVYSMWDGVDPDWNYSMGYGYPNKFLNGTDYDDIFQWGEKYGASKYPPVFPRLPIDYNTLINDTTGLGWGRNTVYILGKGGAIEAGTLAPATDDGTPNGNGTNYALCQLQVGLTESCSTHYNASISGASMSAVCEDEADELMYRKNNNVTLSGSRTLSVDIANVLGDWARSLSLGTGITDANASNSRVLTQMIVTKEKFNTGLPSLAEALAVLTGCTVIQSIIDSPFVLQDWNYTLPTVSPGNYEYFKASVRAQQYISGGNQDYQKGFHLVLFTVFIMSLLITIYFLAHKTWYTDLSEPTTLFSVAVNSPPSDKLAGSCGCGPTGDQYRVSWKLNNDEGHFYYEAAPEGVVDVQSPRMRMSRRFSQSFEMMASPIASVKDRFSRAHT
ncbi:unnamed protein product [Zymoseptoria tritici ST99CH_3D1]|nr:unnamed protein product [Zymoseptoria tritici ST99CH_3D1]